MDTNTRTQAQASIPERRGRICIGAGYWSALGLGIKRNRVFEDGRQIGKLESAWQRSETGERLLTEPKRYLFPCWITGEQTQFMARHHLDAFAVVVDLVGCGVMPHLGWQDLSVRSRIGQAQACMGKACLWPRERSAGYYRSNEA